MHQALVSVVRTLEAGRHLDLWAPHPRTDLLCVAGAGIADGRLAGAVGCWHVANCADLVAWIGSAWWLLQRAS